MNYYEPRQVNPAADRPDAGKWRYTSMNDGRVWPVGYCAEGCPGHEDAAGAYEHQTEYELDGARFVQGPSVVDSLQRHKCEVCGTLTTSHADVGPGMPRSVDLCVAHLNREGLAQVYKVGNVVSS